MFPITLITAKIKYIDNHLDSNIKKILLIFRNNNISYYTDPRNNLIMNKPINNDKLFLK